MNGFRVVGEKSLLEQVGGVKIDYSKTGWQEGFQITEGNKDPNACGSCSC